MKYRIEGSTLPVVTCELSENEQMISESGSMSWMSANMKMETTSRGGIGKAFGRMFSGESLFLNRYTAIGGDGMITFAAGFPGSIVPLEVTPERSYIVQKSAFLASTAGVDLSIHVQKRLGAGFFGGEGFIMQRLSGRGLAFVEIDGHATEYQLRAGEQIIVDTGYLAMMEDTCTMEITRVTGAKNVFFGGEGLFHTVVRGPGKVVLQSMPIYKLAASLIPYLPSDK